MQQIHQFFHEAVIDWVIKEELTEILSASGFVHQTFHYKRRGGLKLYLKLIQEIRREKYDYVLDLQGLLRSGIITFLSKGGTKLGVADGREFSTIFYSSIGEKSRKKEIHAIDKLTPFLTTLGINDFDPSLPLKFYNSYLREETKKLIGNNPYIMLFPESRRSEKILGSSLEAKVKIKLNKKDFELFNYPMLDGNFPMLVGTYGYVRKVI